MLLFASVFDWMLQYPIDKLFQLWCKDDKYNITQQWE